MADVTTICNEIAACCGVPNDTTFKRWVSELLCNIAQSAAIDAGDGFQRVLCDDDGDALNPFVRVVFVDCTQTICTRDIDIITGAAYTIVGSVVQCPEFQGNFIPLCDLQADGTVVSFLRQVIYDPVAGTIGFSDRDLTGVNPYVSTGTVVTCEQAEIPAYQPAVFAALASLAAGSIVAGYTAVAVLPANTRLVTLSNQTNGDVIVSLDGGVTDHYHLASGSSPTLDLGANNLESSGDVRVKDGVTNSTTGSFYLSSGGA